MIVFLHVAGCQADLVAIGAVACSRTDGDLTLRQLARQGFADGCARVGAAGYAHCLINIRASGQRIADSAAQAGGRTTKGFNFCRMVVRFVFEHHQPFLRLAVHLNRNDDGAGVDFLGLIQILQLTLLAQLLHADYGNVHQRYRAVSILTVNLVTCGHILVIGLLYRLGIGSGDNIDILNLCHKGSVTAVVRPIGIQHADFGNSRLTVLLVKIFLAPQKVIQAHSQAHGLAQRLGLVGSHGQKACNALHIGRLLTCAHQGFWLSLLCFACFDGVNAICFNLGDFILA